MPPESVLDIGLLNMMADGALVATERQFDRLLNGPDRTAAARIHPFTFPQLERGENAQAHIADRYRSFEELRTRGLDALIVTGINLADPELSGQAFWDPLIEVMAWALENVRSTLCSCLATHAVMQFRYDCRRRPMPAKLWGVYPHRVTEPDHPLVRGLPAIVPVPHSRFNEITPAQLRSAGLRNLIVGAEAGLHLAVGEGGRLVLMQGHPEYDDISLLKEYKREVGRFVAGERPDYPALLHDTLDEAGERILAEHRQAVENRCAAGKPPPEFPEASAAVCIRGVWHEPAARVMTNWTTWLAGGRSE